MLLVKGVPVSLNECIAQFVSSCSHWPFYTSSLIGGDQLEGFKVVLGNGNRPLGGRDLEGDLYKKCGTYTEDIDHGDEVTLRCDGEPTGQKLYIYLPRDDAVLKICGIKAYRPADPEGNISMYLRKTALLTHWSYWSLAPSHR